MDNSVVLNNSLVKFSKKDNNDDGIIIRFWRELISLE